MPVVPVILVCCDCVATGMSLPTLINALSLFFTTIWGLESMFTFPSDARAWIIEKNLLESVTRKESPLGGDRELGVGSVPMVSALLPIILGFGPCAFTCPDNIDHWIPKFVLSERDTSAISASISTCLGWLSNFLIVSMMVL